MRFSEVLLALVTIIPSLAWFVTAFTNIYKMSKEHEEEIKKVAEQVKTTVELEAEKLKEKIESHKNPKDDTESGTKDSGPTH